jgi:hypothetical protein
LNVKTLLTYTSSNQKIHLKEVKDCDILVCQRSRDNKKYQGGTNFRICTLPEENFSMIESILFLDMFFNPEWHPTRNSHFQKSRHFKFWRMCAITLATIILFTKTMHFIFSSSLFLEQTKGKK